jgi:hypothetical protein
MVDSNWLPLMTIDAASVVREVKQHTVLQKNLILSHL